MLINNDEMEKRLNNPLNLLNRVKSGTLGSGAVKKEALSLFTKGKSVAVPVTETERVEVSFARSNSSTPSNLPARKETIPLPADSPSVSVLIDDADAKIKLSQAHDNALELLTSSINSLKKKVEEGEVKASSIPSIITSASRVITDIRKERLEREKANEGQNVHYHFYCPEQKKISEFEIIDVAG